MNNPLYDLLNRGKPQQPDILARFQQFKNTFQGDPKTAVQRLLDSGQITQMQYDNAVKMANQLLKFVR